MGCKQSREPSTKRHGGRCVAFDDNVISVSPPADDQSEMTASRNPSREGSVLQSCQSSPERDRPAPVVEGDGAPGGAASVDDGKTTDNKSTDTVEVATDELQRIGEEKGGVRRKSSSGTAMRAAQARRREAKT